MGGGGGGAHGGGGGRGRFVEGSREGIWEEVEGDGEECGGCGDRRAAARVLSDAPAVGGR